MSEFAARQASLRRDIRDTVCEPLAGELTTVYSTALQHNASGSPHIVQLAGTGIEALPVVTIFFDVVPNLPVEDRRSHTLGRPPLSPM